MSKFRRGTASVARSKRSRVTPAARQTTRRARPPGKPAPKAMAKPGGTPAKTVGAKAKVAPGTAAVLAIGDEVLRGEVTNANAAFLSDLLFDAGYDVRFHRVVSDRPADIRAVLEDLASEVSVIVATGGLGPTEDDRTVEVVCDLMGVTAV
jgi:hypothetical protein